MRNDWVKPRLKPSMVNNTPFGSVSSLQGLLWHPMGLPKAEGALPVPTAHQPVVHMSLSLGPLIACSFNQQTLHSDCVFNILGVSIKT